MVEWGVEFDLSREHISAVCAVAHIIHGITTPFAGSMSTSLVCSNRVLPGCALHARIFSTTTYVVARVHSHICPCTRVCMYVCMYVCVYVRLCACVRARVRDVIVALCVYV